MPSTLVILTDTIDLIVYFKPLNHPLIRDKIIRLADIKSMIDSINEMGLILITIIAIIIFVGLIKLIYILS